MADLKTTPDGTAKANRGKRRGPAGAEATGSGAGAGGGNAEDFDSDPQSGSGLPGFRDSQAKADVKGPGSAETRK